MTATRASAALAPLPLALLAGGAAVITGTLLPWLTLFAGLQRYSGLTGRNGWIVLAGGAAAIAIGLTALLSARPWHRAAALALGGALAGFTAWLLVGVLQLVQRSAANPMVLARVGPGLFVVAAGTLVIVLAATVGARRR